MPIFTPDALAARRLLAPHWVVRGGLPDDPLYNRPIDSAKSLRRTLELPRVFPAIHID
jgi:hypothetical protein